MAITLDVNAKLDVGQIRLDVGAVTEVLSVDAEATSVVTTNTMEKAFLVDRTQISELPMNGRNWVALMNTVPGMSSSARNDFDVNFNDVSQFHGLGGRGSQNNFYLDGSPNLDVGDNQSQYTQPSIDSIAEFRVLQSGFNAEYGRNEGMAVAVQTKSGAARFHGTAYEYLRNDFFDAKCVLCNTLSADSCATTSSAATSAAGFRSRNSPRARTRRLFFFYNREMTRRVLPSSAYADIPNATDHERRLQPVSAHHQHDVCAAVQERHGFPTRDHHARRRRQHHRRNALRRQRSSPIACGSRSAPTC